ncbi:MAG: FlgD immunoglobulin-like domain containing protein, partial [bacterium]
VDGLALSAAGDSPVVLRLAGNFPNPFNPSTTIRFALPAAGPVRVTVYDLAGGRVRTLLRATRPAGDNTVVWNGRDDAGRPVASGAYYARLEFGGTTQISKMVLLK